MGADRSCRAALAAAVAEVERLGGCVDEDCRRTDCWLGGLSARPRQHAEDAVLFVLDRSIGLATENGRSPS